MKRLLRACGRWLLAALALPLRMLYAVLNRVPDPRRWVICPNCAARFDAGSNALFYFLLGVIVGALLEFILHH